MASVSTSTSTSALTLGVGDGIDCGSDELDEDDDDVVDSFLVSMAFIDCCFLIMGLTSTAKSALLLAGTIGAGGARRFFPLLEVDVEVVDEAGDELRVLVIGVGCVIIVGGGGARRFCLRFAVTLTLVVATETALRATSTLPFTWLLAGVCEAKEKNRVFRSCIVEMN